MSRLLHPALLTAVILAGCAAPQPLPQSDLLPLALGQTTLPPEWKHTRSPGEFDAAMLGFTISPELQSLLTEARQRNTDLRMAAARVEQARATLKGISGTDMPMVALGAQGGVSALPSSSSGTSGAALVVSWELDLWGRARSDQKAAEARYHAATLDVRYSSEAVAAAVIRAWLAISEAQQQKQLSDDMVRLSQRQLELKIISQKIGRDSAQSVALAEASVASYRQQQAACALSLNRSQRALEILLGRYPSADILAAEKFPDVTAQLPAGLPSELMNRRPDLMAAEQQFHAAFLDVASAKRARLPSITLVGGAGHVADSTYQLKQELDNPVWAVTGQLIAPLFTAGKLKAAVTVKNAKQEEAIARYAKTALNALNEVEEALVTDQNLALRQEAVNQQLAALEKSLHYIEQMQKTGSANDYQLQQQRLSIAAVKAEQLRLQNTRLANRITLHQALGGHFPG